MLRNDFVSNSSSCSFIVGFKDKKTMENFRDALKEEWGGKIAILLDEFFKNNEYHNQEVIKDVFKGKNLELFYEGIYSSTEDIFDNVCVGRLIWDRVDMLNDDIVAESM